MSIFSRFFYRSGHALYARGAGRWLIRSALRFALVRRVATMALVLQEAKHRRTSVRKLMSLANPAVQLRFADQVGRLARSRRRDDYVDIYWLVLANSTAVENAWELLSNPEKAPHAKKMHQATNLRYAQAIAAYELARYRDAVSYFLAIQERDPDELKLNHDYLKAAYSAGQIQDKGLALRFFAQQFVDLALPRSDLRGVLKNRILRQISRDTVTALSPFLADAMGGRDTLRLGVFYLSSTEALGHAILDPYHFLALHRDKYDQIFFIGPSRDSYRPASRVCLEIVEQYGVYLETSSDSLLNLSWMSLGTFGVGPLNLIIQDHCGHDPVSNLSWFGPRNRSTVSLELVVDHYWSLLREVFHRSTDPTDSFRHNAWHMKLPPAIERFGREFCKDEGIELGQPLIVLHARDQRYHNIGKQAFRDARIGNYLEAIEYLLGSGYQVVRIGDDGMSRLRFKHPDYFELPFMDGYDHRLDPFFISQARFMIGCQSGPCAYARAFGVPLLSVNAVLHYTLLPGAREMACPKRYFRLGDDGERLEEIDIEKALAAGVAHFDNGYQYKINRIGVCDASSGEILAAVKDMLAWLERPDMPQTADQQDFGEAVEHCSAALKRRGPECDLPIGDYLGIALPDYRISPTVASMRSQLKPKTVKPRIRRVRSRSRATA